MVQRIPPVEVNAPSPPKDPKNAAAIVFIHGLADDGAAWEPVAHQFKNAGVLTYAHWIFPNALEVRDVMSTAWYVPTRLPAMTPSRPELADDEDEDGLLASRKYIESVLDDVVKEKGVPPERIVLAGFSQGCVMTMLTGLTSEKYAGKLAGLAGFCGYMAMEDKMVEMRKEAGLPDKLGKMQVFLARGTKDMLVPGRLYHRLMKNLEDLGLDMSGLEGHEMEGVSHAVNAQVMKDFAAWVERIVPAKE